MGYKRISPNQSRFQGGQIRGLPLKVGDKVRFKSRPLDDPYYEPAKMVRLGHPNVFTISRAVGGGDFGIKEVDDNKGGNCSYSQELFDKIPEGDT